MSNKITFYRKPAKHGPKDFVFTIPRLYIRTNIIDPNIKYEISLKVFSENRERIAEKLNNLDDKFVLNEIDPETYYRLRKKYQKMYEESLES